MYEHLGSPLATLRKRWQLSQAEVAEQLTQMGIPVTNRAISHWEQERTQPSSTQFLGLCAIYRIRDVVTAFGEYKLPSHRAELNNEGVEKVEEFTRILVASGMFRVQDNVIPFVQRSMPIYDLPASAGTGVFLDSSEYEMVPVGPEVPVNANFGVRVSGDSMEPAYLDQQIVWVQQQPTLEDGDVGIFLLNGHAYIKQWNPTSLGVSLVSFNQAYEPISIQSDDELRTFGKVLS